MHEVSLLIDGVSRGASDGATFDRIDPATGQVASRAAAATLADADAAVAGAAPAVGGGGGRAAAPPRPAG
ncbi:hypothetical protein I7819_07705, partial [Burkholderia multivorans]|nr:hypothetical protein [Burkholderia multivorans]